MVASLPADAGRRAVVCASAGNLGQALARSGRTRDVDVTVVASRSATTAKLDRIRALGTTLELVDGDHEPARERAASPAGNAGVRLLEDSLDLETCEGAGTLGRDPVDSGPPFDTVVLTLGGGAPATGVGHVLEELVPHVEVVCVQALDAPALAYSSRRRRVVTTASAGTIADGVAGRFPIPAVPEDLLLVADDVVPVREKSIVAGMRLLLHHAGLVVEPSADVST